MSKVTSCYSKCQISAGLILALYSAFDFFAIVSREAVLELNH